MKIVGIDLSGPRNFADTCLVSFEERGEHIQLVNVREGADDDQILEVIAGFGEKEHAIIGIDAPLSYNPKGGDRPSDSELRRFVHSQGGRVGIMPPRTRYRSLCRSLRGRVRGVAMGLGKTHLVLPSASATPSLRFCLLIKSIYCVSGIDGIFSLHMPGKTFAVMQE